MKKFAMVVLLAWSGMLVMNGQSRMLYQHGTEQVGTNDVFAYLKSKDAGFKGNDKRMRRIVQFANECVEEDRRHENPALFMNGRMNQDEAGFSLGHVPQVMSADGHTVVYDDNVDVLSYGSRVYGEGWTYNKRPIVWFLNGCYFMTTGYRGKWEFGKQPVQSLPPDEQVADEWQTMPISLSSIASVDLSDDLTLLDGWLPTDASIRKKSPLFVLIRTLEK